MTFVTMKMSAFPSSDWMLRVRVAVTAAGKTCASMGLGIGTLVCTSGCALDTTGCHVCGNNGLEGPELCDGGNLGGQTCITRGHDGGTLGCADGIPAPGYAVGVA